MSKKAGWGYSFVGGSAIACLMLGLSKIVEPTRALEAWLATGTVVVSVHMICHEVSSLMAKWLELEPKK